MAAKILVVEDDRNLLDTLKYNLRKEGYNAVTAVDGAEALDIARRENPDLKEARSRYWVTRSRK